MVNTVQNTQQQLATQLQQIQGIMQAIQIQYVAVPQNAHQDHGGHGYHGGHTNYCGQGRRSTQRRLNWQDGCGGHVNSDITHYCCTHVMCSHPGKYCRTPLEGQRAKLHQISRVDTCK